MTDRELLELAAKAAGYIVVGHYEYGLKIECHDGGEASEGFVKWCPHLDDGDALRLAVDCGIGMRFHDGWGEVFHPVGHLESKYDGDKQTTTRFAISMLASEIGKGMK